MNFSLGRVHKLLRIASGGCLYIVCILFATLYMDLCSFCHTRIFVQYIIYIVYISKAEQVVLDVLKKERVSIGVRALYLPLD